MGVVSGFRCGFKWFQIRTRGIGCHPNPVNSGFYPVDSGLDSGGPANSSLPAIRTWDGYETRSQTLKVRLGKLNELKSKNPIVSHNIGLFKIWGNQIVFMG
jgi:hypothetical protein